LASKIARAICFFILFGLKWKRRSHNAQNKDQPGRCQAIQEDRYRQIRLSQVACQPYFDQKNNQTQTLFSKKPAGCQSRSEEFEAAYAEWLVDP
jgi:hypothetical protein